MNWRCIIVALSILLISGADAQYFGTKVVQGDIDIGLPLSSFASPQQPLFLRWWDVGPNPLIFDSKDVVYLHVGLAPSVSANDIRLTDWDVYSAGSKVMSNDNDIGQSTMPLPNDIAAGIYFIDSSGSTPGYDFNDPVYLKTVFSPLGPSQVTATNDVRLTTFNFLLAGLKVSNFDVDNTRPLIPMIAPWPATGFCPPGPGPLAVVNFYNSNGNALPSGIPIYDESDIVYIDVVPLGIVSVNDVRICNPA